MVWSHAARQASIASRRARKGTGHVAGMQNLVQQSGMPKQMQARMKTHLKVLKNAMRGR